MARKPDKSTPVAARIVTWLFAFIGIWIVLDYGQPLLMPLVLAVFTSILIYPILAFLVAHRIPGPVAIAVSQVVGFLPIVGFIVIFVFTVGPVQDRLPWYQKQLRTQISEKIDEVIDWMEAHDLMPNPDTAVRPARTPSPGANGSATDAGETHGLASANDPQARDPDGGTGDTEDGDPGETEEPAPPYDEDQNPAMTDDGTPHTNVTAADVDEPWTLSPKERLRREWKGQIIPTLLTEGATFAQSILGTTTVVVMNLFLVVLFTTFILIEGSRFGEKTEEAFGKDNPIMLSLLSIAGDVRTYLVAKTLISAMTGLVVWIFLTVMAVDFAGFWGLATFALNYIPNIGSIAASIPPILIALLNSLLSLDVSIWNPIIVAAGLLTVQTVIGSFMDPRLVGASLKLSPFVILLSMLTWGLLWGPIGMILSVPIMVCFKIICSHVEGLEPIATMMKA